MSGGRLETTYLPPDAPDNVIVSPSMNRWGNGVPGHLPKMLQSVQGALSREGLSDDTWMLVSDASNTPDAEALRHEQLNRINGFNRPARLFFMTPELQARVTRTIVERTGVDERIVKAILLDTGYASQRIKLDTVLAGLVTATAAHIKVLTLDDDTVIPERYGVVKPEFMPQGLSHKPNSQVLLHDEHVREGIFDFRDNKIEPFFRDLGLTVADLRAKYPGFRATGLQKDTMHVSLEDAVQGRPAQFEVSHDDKSDLEGVEQAQVIAASATKFGIPDYRTVRIAQANYESEFPDREVPINALISGPSKPFAFRESLTNVDSAAMARLFNDKTVTLPWWFVSSDAISRQNPLQTVTAHYRADNELLPVLFRELASKGDEQYLYMSGLATQVEHNRARTGYRPDLHEQATASLVGNVAALEAAKRLLIDSATGQPILEKIDDDYRVPEEMARRVFDEMHKLSLLCALKINELDSRKRSATSQQSHSYERMIDRYHEIMTTIKAKLGNNNFEEFSVHLNTEIRDQLRFYSGVLKAFPKVVDQVQKMIVAGEYPVQEFVYDRPTLNSGIRFSHGGNGVNGATDLVAQTNNISTGFAVGE